MLDKAIHIDSTDKKIKILSSKSAHKHSRPHYVLLKISGPTIGSGPAIAWNGTGFTTL